MVPKKAKEFLKPTAEEFGVSEQLVEIVTDFYWKSVRQNLSDLSAPTIMIANFGSFNVKPSILEKERDNYQKYVDKLQGQDLTFQKHKLMLDVEGRIRMIDNMREMYQKDLSRRKEIKSRRNEDFSKTDMGSKDEDPRGC